jgi:hypothetical protein
VFDVIRSAENVRLRDVVHERMIRRLLISQNGRVLKST